MNRWRVGEYGLVVECWPSIQKALGLISGENKTERWDMLMLQWKND